MEYFSSKGEFVKGELFKNIPQWTVWQCLRYLSCSETTQGYLQDATAAEARAAAGVRILIILQQNSGKPCIKDSDYALIFEIVNTMKEIMDMRLAGAQFPTMSEESIANGELKALLTYNEQTLKYLHEQRRAAAAGCNK
jgi:hypothetical protein